MGGCIDFVIFLKTVGWFTTDGGILGEQMVRHFLQCHGASILCPMSPHLQEVVLRWVAIKSVPLSTAPPSPSTTCVTTGTPEAALASNSIVGGHCRHRLEPIDRRDNSLRQSTLTLKPFSFISKVDRL